MFHYEYNEDDLIIRKVSEPTGERVASCNEDFDLQLYDVVIGFLSENKEILRHTKKLRSVDNVARRIQDLSNKIEPTIDINTCTLEDLKKWQIRLSNENLSAHLYKNPVFSTCHNPEGAYYSITSDKQTYLAQMIMVTQMAMQNNIPYQPSWNESGKPCTYDWTLEQLSQLAFEIESVVRPLINKQQLIEQQIKECETKEEVLEVDVEF